MQTLKFFFLKISNKYLQPCNQASMKHCNTVFDWDSEGFTFISVTLEQKINHKYVTILHEQKLRPWT